MFCFVNIIVFLNLCFSSKILFDVIVCKRNLQSNIVSKYINKMMIIEIWKSAIKFTRFFYESRDYNRESFFLIFLFCFQCCFYRCFYLMIFDIIVKFVFAKIYCMFECVCFFANVMFFVINRFCLMLFQCCFLKICSNV